MSRIRIRPEQPDDHEKVFAIHVGAFNRSSEAKLVEVLRSSAQPQLSLVAELGSRLVGHVFFSPVSIESEIVAPPCAGLAPVGVLPEHQRCGVGSALVRKGLEHCSSVGWQAVFLVGSPVYYAQFGFDLALPRGLHYAGGGFENVFQVTELETDVLRGCRGRVHFHPAFSQLSAE